MPGSLTTPGRPSARDDAPGGAAFHHLHGVGTQNRKLSRLNGWLCAPLSTLRRGPRGPLRMTRGRRGSLLLHRKGLAPSTPCRSPGASQMWSGSPHKADLGGSLREVAFVPMGDIALFWKACFSQSVLDGGEVFRSAERSPIPDSGYAHRGVKLTYARCDSLRISRPAGKCIACGGNQ